MNRTTDSKTTEKISRMVDKTKKSISSLSIGFIQFIFSVFGQAKKLNLGFFLKTLSTPIAILVLASVISPISKQASYENQCIEGYLDGIKESENEISNKRWKNFLGYSTAVRVCRRLGIPSVKQNRSNG